MSQAPDDTQTPSPSPSPSPRTVQQELADTLAEYGQVQYNLKRFRARELELEARILELDTLITSGAK